MATNFFIVESNICGYSVWNLFQVTLLGPRIFMWLLEFWKICTPLHYLTPCSRVLLKKLSGLQIVKKLPTFDGTRSILLHLQAPVTCPCP